MTNPTEPVPWPDAVRALMRSAGLSEQGLADRLDVSLSTVGRWVREGTVPAGRNRRALLKLLRQHGITVDETPRKSW